MIDKGATYRKQQRDKADIDIRTLHHERQTGRDRDKAEVGQRRKRYRAYFSSTGLSINCWLLQQCWTVHGLIES